MSVPARLKWRKEKDRFAAYPLGSHQSERCVWLRPNIGKYGSWLWNATWPGWFVESGFTEGKQAAADAATDAWWRLVNTDVPRDVDLEVAMLVARLLVRPAPNSIFGEDPDYLRKILNQISMLYQDEIKADALPVQVKNLMEQISGELLRRRVTGEIPDPPKDSLVISGGYRRRRRR